MIEALACGTPVIAWPRGSVPEVITDGVTGYIIDTVTDAVLSVARAAELDRRDCRQAFEQRFDAARMTGDYVEVYRRLTQSSAARGASSAQP